MNQQTQKHKKNTTKRHNKAPKIKHVLRKHNKHKHKY